MPPAAMPISPRQSAWTRTWTKDSRGRRSRCGREAPKPGMDAMASAKPFVSKLRRAAEVAAVRRRDRHAGGRIFVELVAQRADRDAEDVRRVGAVAEAVLERLQDQVALDVGDGAADERAGDGLRGKGR